MKTVYADRHGQHAPAHEFMGGRMQEFFEKPERAQHVLDSVTARFGITPTTPDDFPEADYAAVHDAAYVAFLKSAHAAWRAAGFEGDTFGEAFNVQHPGAPVPDSIEGRLGLYTADGSVPLTATSWEAIANSANAALTAQKLIADGEKSAFALCRPPGHHATKSCASGYCFLNNAAIAAQKFIVQGASRVAVLDVDYHHGNGTQDIFYDRADVLFASIHADPMFDYPHFAGHASETGTGKGEGFNLNLPLPEGVAWDAYAPALDAAVKRIRDYSPDALVISLGVDTFEKDPISRFKLKAEDYTRTGAAIAKAAVPTLFVLEGGYAVEEIGVNVANVLEGFLEG